MSSDNVKNENPGVVTSDSLAAESIRDGGDFAVDSSSRGPNAQPSRGTTTNVTDVSNTTVLPPAPDASARFENEAFDPDAVLNEGIGEGKDAGRGPTWNTPSSADTLQDFTNSSQPRGQDLKEGGFDPDAPNASFSTAIGTKKDPGRVALQQFEASDAAAAAGAGPRQTEISNDGQFDILKDTSA